ncbi:methyltransferase family protein [Terrabacter sp. 2RAF25]|uniref:methyltransferase family protein n=1 Tax=Terrabacter sp. 2RAF25 TaxID=3232998 RepID=UPI003F95DAFC
MNRRPTHLALSAFGWVGFACILVWTIVFLAMVGIPRTVDAPARTTPVRAIAVDLALLLLFAVQHSVMARRSVKARLARHVPAALERTTFVLATNLCLALLLALWEPWGGTVWHVGGLVAVVLWTLCAAGWVLAVTSTFAVDHLDLLGLRQAGWARPRPFEPSGVLRVDGLHGVVRHPLMTGLLLAFWATPEMGAGHLLFAVAATGYVAVGVTFEERDLRRTFGAAYDAYAARVPALLPRTRVRRRVAASR